MDGAALAAMLALSSACSHVDFRWQAAGDPASAATAVKHLAIVGLADEAATPGLSETLGVVAAEFAKLRRNYLVAQAPLVGGGHERACAAGGVEGALVLHALEAQADDRAVALTLRAELWRCQGPRLLWQAQGHRRLPAHDVHLAALTESYRSGLGEAAGRWAAASFVLAQELLGQLPDPTLTDADIEEKLELGAAVKNGPAAVAASSAGPARCRPRPAGAAPGRPGAETGWWRARPAG